MNLKVQKIPLLIFVIYSILGTYLLAVAFNDPLVNIQVTEKNNKWIISSLENEKWAEKYNISTGNEIIGINGLDVNLNTEVLKWHRITNAESITIQSNNTKSTIKITYSDFPRQFLLQVLIPTIYFIMSLFICISYLSKISFYNCQQFLLMFLLMSISTAYISGNASSKFDFIGLLVNTSFIVTSLVLLIQFINYYLHILIIEKFIKVFYILPFLLLIINGVGYWYNLFYRWGTILTLALIVLLGSILIYLMYRHRSNEKASYVFYAILVPVLPFILLYCLPLIFIKEPIIQADIATLFLILLPFLILFTNITEKLFDIQYYINRLQYYSLLAICISFLSAVVTYLVVQIKFSNLFLVFIIEAIFILILLFLKENIDFQKRNILFTTKGNNIQNLYGSIYKLKNALSVEQLVAIFIQELQNTLDIKKEDITILYEPLMDHQNESKIFRNSNEYYLSIYNTSIQSLVLRIKTKSKKLSKEKILWLELMVVYVNVFIYNLAKIEDLLKQIEKQKFDKNNHFPWLDIMIWSSVEKEKQNLAQELHDTILQEQIHITRQLDLLSTQVKIPEESFQSMRNQLLDVNQNLRSYCELLNPPLLDTLGLKSAIENYLNKVRLRSDFKLISHIELIEHDNDSFLLIIYRIVQELCNNAIKHSKASKVCIVVTYEDCHYKIKYSDNGIGFNLNEVYKMNNTMGIRGIQQRVDSFSGKMIIDSTHKLGTEVKISFEQKNI